MYFQEICLKNKNKEELKVKGRKNIFQVNANQKKASVGYQYKINFKAKSMIRSKRVIYNITAFNFPRRFNM